MKTVITGYTPAALFRYFEEISRIPRGSGNEKGIADYLVAFAAERKLECLRDEHHNVFIRKPASRGYENRPAVMLQGHTDMVCEKDSGTEHDFERDPLDLYVEDGWLKARGTTLGGDDGVAVALMLWILDDDTVLHPTLECLFTTGEETGLYGATGFDYRVVTAKKLINLDSEAEGIATVSCAGGIAFDFRLRPDRLPLPSLYRPLTLSISGLAGGHSGEDIKHERGNADILLMQMLAALYDTCPFNLVTLEGGTRGNAIPRESRAVLMTSDPDGAKAFLLDYAKTVKGWLPKEDSAFRVRVEKAKGDFTTMLSFADTNRLLTLALTMPNGIIAKMRHVEGMVETSNNLGVIRDEGEKGILLVYHGRSAYDSKMDVMQRQAERLAKALGFELDVNGRYSGWPMKEKSPLAADFLRVAKEVLGDKVTPRLAAIHAGLECGIICAAVKDMDAISIGPELKDIHSPREALELASLGRLSEIVARLLAE